MTFNIPLCVVTLLCVVGMGIPHVSVAATHVEDAVREYFEDIPVMIEVARCESEFRQFNADGSVLRGGWAGGMVGIFQFFESIHTAQAKGLGHDLLTLEGNLAYARHLYAQSGTTPWNSARSCWENAVPQKNKEELTQAEIERLEAHIASLVKMVAMLQTLLEEKQTLSMR